MPCRRQKGQVVMLVLVALSLFVIGAIGLAIDGSHLYAQRQMAQAAADSAAQAAAMSVLGESNKSAVYNNDFGSSNFPCTNGTDPRTPCAYARLSGFGETGSSDIVEVSFPDASTAPGVDLSPLFDPKLITVTITRPVNTTLMRWLGSTSANVKVSATCALIQDEAPVPILVLHPDLCESFRRGGTALLKICGGPKQSVQVNSKAPSCVAVDDDGGSLPASGVDLSMAGPNGNELCTSTGPTGGIFGSFGGPSNYPGPFNPGTEGSYQQRPPITDPFADVYPAGPPPPGAPSDSPQPVGAGTNGCPNPNPGPPCMLYSPGYYPNGIEVRKETALFKPGLYYMGSKGFVGGPQSVMLMAKDVPPDTTWGTGTGIVVYSSGPVTAPGVVDAGKFEVGSNGDAILEGPSVDSIWEGILFFQNRNSVAHTGVSGAHKLGGIGNLSLVGSIYLTNGDATTSTRYQELVLRGSSGSNTEIVGNIDVDVLDSGGGGIIKMSLNPNKKQIITKIALVK